MVPNVARHRTNRIALVAITAATIPASGTTGCASARTRPTDERARIETATQHYAAMLRGAPVDSVAAAYTENGELVIPGVATLRGRSAIRDFLAPLTAAVTVASVEMQIDSLTVSGTSATEVGQYRQLAGPKGAPPREYRGTFRATWQQDPDKQWRLARIVMQPAAPRTP
jgi:ketosteroid isomerase-like protein